MKNKPDSIIFSLFLVCLGVFLFLFTSTESFVCTRTSDTTGMCYKSTNTFLSNQTSQIPMETINKTYIKPVDSGRGGKLYNLKIQTAQHTYIVCCYESENEAQYNRTLIEDFLENKSQRKLELESHKSEFLSLISVIVMLAGGIALIKALMPENTTDKNNT